LISVDRLRCAYCGASVSGCPGYAVDLQERRLAAKVAAEAISAGDVSWASLNRYEQEWAAGIGRRMARNYRLRARFPPAQLAGKRFVRLFALTIGAGK